MMVSGRLVQDSKEERFGGLVLMIEIMNFIDVYSLLGPWH